ncbi:MmgE/PrpD family protein [Thermodesulfobacteriota bacterium]
MKEVTQELINFAHEIKFEDLPELVVHESKRILLDSIAVALAGLSIDKGKIMVSLARRFGGPPEASILGTGDKVSCANAALANGELVHAMEYCNLVHPAIHVSPGVLAAVLAIAEYLGSSGKDLILALALAHEIPTRISWGMERWRSYVSEGPDAGKFIRPDVMGYGMNMFGGTLGAGRLLGLDHNQMAHALGIAGYIAPSPSWGKWCRTKKTDMLKFFPAGWMCHAEVTAALLAEMDYTGDQSVLDGEYGFWKFNGSATWNPEEVTNKLGKEWRFADVVWYKKYPSGGVIHGALACFSEIVKNNNLRPEDIDEVIVWTDPVSEMERFNVKEIDGETDAQFNSPYEIAALAYGIPFDRWQNLDTIQNSKIKEFMKKVDNYSHPNYSKIGIDKQLLQRPHRVEVKTNNETFVKEGVWFRGRLYPDTNYPKETQQPDEELISKFRFHAAGTLTTRQVNMAPQVVLHLEDIENTAELMKLVTKQ